MANESNLMEKIRPHRFLWCNSDLKYRDTAASKIKWEEIGKIYELNYEQIKKKFTAIKSKFNKFYSLSKKSGSGAAMISSRHLKFIEDYFWLKDNVEDICKNAEASFSLDQISSHDYEQNIQDVVNVQTSSQDYELNTHDLLTDIVNPTDIYEKEILELDNSFNKENINPCSSKRKNLDTPKSKAKKSKKYEDEKMEIFRGFAAKHTSQGDDPHNIMGFFKSYQAQFNIMTDKEIFDFKLKFITTMLV
ncbi:uncharacterized protein LOC135931474 isoform X2 [Gordionus sp. m RMFG-2023]|uniref:uncharacterized protein LOC135931474 isoform X2 n=1 Tax=Gordionus sp. m RMFG-2023 TaxID=3053472 RepID=UPI0031FDF2D3